ncbi:MAG: glycosyltransferase [bacterium]|nr:MAG: glycosyltransferase [bacterium]
MREDRKDGRPLIAYFSDAPYTGGAERYLWLLAYHLDQARFRAVLIVNRNPALAPLKSWMDGAGVPVHEVSLRLPFSLRGVPEFISVLRRLEPAILHMNLPGPFDAQFSLAAPLARCAGVRRIVTTEHLAMVPTFTKARLLKSFGTRWVDRVITVSEDNRTHLTDIHRVPRGKIRVVHNGIPDPGEVPPAGLREQLSLDPGVHVLIVVAALCERKGHPTLFEAMTQLPAHVHLVAVGEGEAGNEYRRVAAALGLAGRVHFLGQRNDVPALLAEADMLVVPSLIEATPYVIIEAMAAGLPVVASRIYGIPELVSDGVSGMLVSPGDPDKLACALSVLLDDAGACARMGAAGRQRFERDFGIENSVSRTVAVYGELIDLPGDNR